jgi:hypothetical protein
MLVFIKLTKRLNFCLHVLNKLYIFKEYFQGFNHQFSRKYVKKPFNNKY